MRVTILLCALLTGAVITTNAQLVQVSGIVKDNKENVLEAVTVSLLQEDSVWVQSVLTNVNGSFTIHNIKHGKYIIAVNASGFASQMQLLYLTSDNKGLQFILQSNTALKEVTVSSKVPRIETGLGKTIINIEQANTAGNSVWDLLRKSPGVRASSGSVTLQGVNVMVLVDDKQTYLQGQELEDYLKNLSADQVAALELITQPSGKYDAEGSGGIINIKTRRIKKKGINGNISGLYDQHVYANTHNNANLTYRNNKLTAYANAGHLWVTGFLDRIDNRSVKNQQTGNIVTETKQTAFLKEIFADYNLKLGADYELTPKTTIGASTKGIYHPNAEEDVANTIVTDAEGNVTYNNTFNKQGLLRNHYICNVYAKYTIAKGHEITADADYINRRQKNYQNITGRNYDTQLQPISGNLDLRNQSPSSINVVAAKADYNGELGKNYILETGIKCSYANVDNGVYFETLNNDVWIKDTTRTNHFLYKENINAAYITIRKTIGKWNTQAGVRLEHMNNDGEETEQGNAFERSNTSVFPTVFVSYKVNEKNSVELSCGRRINRPAYTMMNPFVNYFSQYYYQKGNPDLSPAFRNYAELKYNHNNKLFTSLGCRKVSGYITPVLGYDANNKAVFSTWGNYADDYVVHLSVSYNKQLTKWWLLTAAGDGYYNRFLSYRGHELLGTSLGGTINIQNQFTFKRGWSADTTLFCTTGDLQNVIDRYGPNYWFGFNISKKVMKEAATLRLSIEDPFKGYNPNSTSTWNGIETSSSLRFGSQSVALGFTYNFGKKIDAKQRLNNTEEAGRM